MRRRFAILTLALAFFRLTAEAQNKPIPLEKGQSAHPTRIVARYKAEQGMQLRAAALTAAGVVERERIPLVPGLVVLDTAAIRLQGQEEPEKLAATLKKKIEELRATGLFEYVQPDYVKQIGSEPTDGSFVDGTLWGLRNLGQSGGALGADVNAVGAWALTTGSREVIVAVVDTGIRYTHQDLRTQMWRNPDEVPGNRIDDDNDGYVDNVHGINAITGSGDPMDDNDHGTHVAGTIGAAANDGSPHVGVCWEVQLMACKFLDSNGSGYESDGIKSVNFAVANGAKIINASYGSTAFSRAEFDAIAAARNRGVLFVAAAGNDGTNNDQTPHYPSNYQLDNIISVAAIDRSDKLADFSNYGVATVHLGAPGVQIYSATSGSDSEYKLFAGTSMATPHVAGVAGLVLARFPGLSMTELRQRLLSTTTRTPALEGRSITGGRVNALSALNATPDGILDVVILPGQTADGALIAGRSTAFNVRVSDLLSITDATVRGSAAGQANIIFRNDGVAPDLVAGDGTYSANVLVPSDSTRFTINVSVSAPGKTSAEASATFPVITPPGNDLLANAIPLSGTSVTGAGTNRGATAEPGEPTHGGVGGGKSVWWSWTAPAEGLITVDTEGSDFDVVLAVYTGSSPNALTLVGSADRAIEFESISFFGEANRTYRIAVDGYRGQTGNIRLKIGLNSSQTRPANDMFANRIPLSGASVTVSGSSVGGTREPGEPDHAGVAAGHSVWWSYTAAQNGRLTIKTDGSSYDTVLGVYTGTQVGALTRIAADDDSGLGANSLVSFSAVQGTTYQIAVDGFESEAGDIILSANLRASEGPPPNDRFEDATTIVGASIMVQGSNVDATKEALEPAHARNSGGKSVWWRWTAPSSGLATIHTGGSSFNTLLGVYTGNSVAALTEVASNDQEPGGGATSRVSFTATAGTTYFLAVDGSNDGFGAASGSIQLLVTLGEIPPAPSNDNFASAVSLSGSSGTSAGSNVGATLESGEPTHAGVAGGRSVWWRWTAPSSGTAVIQTAGSSFDTVLAVYTGNTVGTLTEVTSNDDTAHNPQSLVSFQAAAGATYRIVVDGYRGDTGSIQLAYFFGTGPQNDNFSNAIPLAGVSHDLSGNNFGASREAGEPEIQEKVGGRSVWWRWTAPISGLLTASTEGSDFDTMLGVFTGSAVNGLTAVAENDDAGESDLWSRLSFPVTAGTSYYFLLDGFSGETGNFRLNISVAAAPGNDLFANATVIAPGVQCVQGSNRGASKESGEPAHAGNIGGRSVWWRWRAEGSGRVTVTTDGSSFDTVLAVYRGSAVNALTPVASDDDSGNNLASKLEFIAAAQTEYYIAVDGFDGENGNVSVCLLSTARPANDDFGSRVQITGTLASVSGANVGATRESGEPTHAGNPGGASVWWEWRAPVDATVTISTDGSSFDTLLAVYQGEAVNGLTKVVEDDDGGEGSRSQVTFNATAGSIYQIAVDGYDGETGSIRWSLQGTETSPNALELKVAAFPREVETRGYVLELLGEIGRSYTILISANLVNWEVLTNFQASARTTTVADVGARSFGQRFYKAQVGSPPASIPASLTGLTLRMTYDWGQELFGFETESGGYYQLDGEPRSALGYTWAPQASPPVVTALVTEGGSVPANSRFEIHMRFNEGSSTQGRCTVTYRPGDGTPEVIEEATFVLSAP